AHHRRERERREVADVRREEEMREARHGDPLLVLGHREHAGGPGADGDEADVPERQYARVADEDVERNDDRDLDERVEEVRLEVARDLEPEQSGPEDEHRGRKQLRCSADEAHTRSTAPPPRAKSPFGRTSSTTITAAKRKLGRYWLWFEGSTPPRIPFANPIAKPPSVAGIGRLRPPSTTPASTRIVSWVPKAGTTVSSWTLSITAETAAKSPETITAPEITQLARTPRRRAVRKSIAAARMWSPSGV